jgi:eukaryotic-like serine/threonine-protein kinase
MSRGRRIAGVVVVLALALALWRVTQRAHETDLRLTELTFDAGLTGWPSISADGLVMVYASDRDTAKNLDLYVQHLPNGIPQRITDSPDDESEPSISPDGKSIAYRSTRNGGGVYVMPSTGGDSRLLVSGARSPRYSPDGRFLAFHTDAGAYLIPAAGGAQRQVYPQMPATGTPVWSPDGKSILFAARSDIWVAPPDGGSPQPTGLTERLAEAGLARTLPDDANWTAGGLLFSARSNFTRDLYRCPLDSHGKATGAVARVTTGTGRISQAATARADRVAFASGTQRFDVWGIPLDGNAGKLLGAPYRITDSLAPTAAPALSEDGSKLLFNSSLHGFAEVWLKDLATGKESVVATGPLGASSGRFLRSSGKISYELNDGLYLLEPKTGMPRKLAGASSGLWDVDRKEEAGLVTVGGGADLVDLKSGQHSPLLRAPEREPISELSFSPDDRWILFLMSNGTAANRIYVASASRSEQIPFASWIPLTDGSGKVSKPRFSPDGKLIYFTRDGLTRTVDAVRFDAESGHSAGNPFTVFDGGTPRLSLAAVNLAALELGVSADKLIVILGESSSNIWIAVPVPRP